MVVVSALPDVIHTYLAKGLSTTYEMMRCVYGDDGGVGSTTTGGRVLTDDRVLTMWNSFVSAGSDTSNIKGLRLLRNACCSIRHESTTTTSPTIPPVAFMDGDVFSAVPYALTTFLPTLSGACARAVLDGHITPLLSEGVVVFAVQVIAEMLFLPIEGEAVLERDLWGTTTGCATPTSIRDVLSSHEDDEGSTTNPAVAAVDTFLDVRDLLLQCCSTTPREVVMGLGLTTGGADPIDELNPTVPVAEDDEDDAHNKPVEVSTQLINPEDDIRQKSISSLRTHILSCGTSSFYRYLLHAMYLREGARVLLSKSKAQLQDIKVTVATLDNFNTRIWFEVWRTMAPRALLLFTQCVVVPVVELRFYAADGASPGNELTTPSTTSNTAVSSSSTTSSSTPEVVLRSLLLDHHIAPFCQYVTNMTVQGISQLLLQQQQPIATDTINPIFRVPADVSITTDDDGNDPTTWHNTVVDISITLLSEIYGLAAASEVYVSHFGTSSINNTDRGITTTTPLAFMRGKMMQLNAQKEARLDTQVAAIVRRQLPMVVKEREGGGEVDEAEVALSLANAVRSQILARAHQSQKPNDTVPLHTGVYPLLVEENGDTSPSTSSASPSTSVITVSSPPPSLLDVIHSCVGDLLQVHPPTQQTSSTPPTSMVRLALHTSSTYCNTLVLEKGRDNSSNVTGSWRSETTGVGVCSDIYSNALGTSSSAIFSTNGVIGQVGRRMQLVLDATVFSDEEDDDGPTAEKKGDKSPGVVGGEELKLLQQFGLEGSSLGGSGGSGGGGASAPIGCWGTEKQVPWSNCAVAGVVCFRLSRVLKAMTIQLPWSGCPTLSDVPTLLDSLEEYRDGVVLSMLYHIGEEETRRNAMSYSQTLDILVARLREGAVHALGEAAVLRVCGDSDNNAWGLLRLLRCLFDGGSNGSGGLGNINVILKHIYSDHPPKEEESTITKPSSAASRLRESIAKEAGVLCPTYRVSPPSSSSPSSTEGETLSWWLASAARFARSGETSAVYDGLANIILRAFNIQHEEEDNEYEYNDGDDGCSKHCRKLSVELLRCYADPQGGDRAVVEQSSPPAPLLPPLPLLSPVTVVSVVYQALTTASTSHNHHNLTALKGPSVEGLLLCLTHCLRVESIQPQPIPPTRNTPPPPTMSSLPHTTLALMMRALLVAYAYLGNGNGNSTSSSSSFSTCLRLPSNLYDFPHEYIPAHIPRGDLTNRLAAARHHLSAATSCASPQTAVLSTEELVAMMTLAVATSTPSQSTSTDDDEDEDAAVDPVKAVAELTSCLQGADKAPHRLVQCCPSVVGVLRGYGVKPVAAQQQHDVTTAINTTSNLNGVVVSLLPSGPSVKMVHRLLSAGVLPITSLTQTDDFASTRFDKLVDAACHLCATYPHVLQKDEHHTALLDVLCSEAYDGELYGESINNNNDGGQLWRSPEFKRHVDFLQTLLTSITTVTSVEHRELAISVFEGAMGMYTPRIRGKMLMVLLSGSPHSSVQSVLLNTLSTGIAASYSSTTKHSSSDLFVSHQMVRSFINIATLVVDNIIATHQPHQETRHVDPTQNNDNEHQQQPVLSICGPTADARGNDDVLGSNVAFILRFLNIMQSLIVGELTAVRGVSRRGLLLSPLYFNNNKDGSGQVQHPFLLWRLQDSMLSMGMMPTTSSSSTPHIDHKAVVLRRTTFIHSQKSLSAICTHLHRSILSPLRMVLSSPSSKISDLDKFGLERILDLFAGSIYVQQ